MMRVMLSRLSDHPSRVRVPYLLRKPHMVAYTTNGLLFYFGGDQLNRTMMTVMLPHRRLNHTWSTAPTTTGLLFYFGGGPLNYTMMPIMLSHRRLNHAWSTANATPSLLFYFGGGRLNRTMMPVMLSHPMPRASFESFAKRGLPHTPPLVFFSTSVVAG